MKFTTRRATIILLILLTGAAIFYGARSFVFSRIEAGIREKIESLRSSGFNVRYDSLSINWRSNLIEIHHLLLDKNAYDTACIFPESISVGKLRGEGLGLFSLIFKGVLSFDDLYINDLRVTMRENSQFDPDSSSRREKDFTLSIDRTYLMSAEFTYTDSATCRVISGIRTNATIDGLTLDFLVDSPFTYQANWLSLEHTEINLPEALYTVRIKETHMDFAEEALRIDSALVIPTAGKVEFGRKHGFEIDRFQAVIPFFECHDIVFNLNDSSMIKASLADIQFYLKVFRDKRQPFVKKQKLLPVSQLRNLPFVLLIDSLKVRKSYVQYEEYAEDASEPGMVYFDNLYASIYNIDNASNSGSTLLSAQADLQGKGKIHLRVTFPLEDDKRSTLVGSIVDFHIPEINPMLVPSTNIKVESGQMEDLSFHFSFNAIRSDGKLELKYEDLKLVIFKEEDKANGQEPEKDNLKTFIMNTFIFKKNMDEDVPEEKRTGAIGYMRDNNRSIFNFWVKSLVSGIKSAYNLDKVEVKKDEKEVRQEQRLSKREARKQRRAARKRERG